MIKGIICKQIIRSLVLTCISSTNYFSILNTTDIVWISNCNIVSFVGTHCCIKAYRILLYFSYNNLRLMFANDAFFWLKLSSHVVLLVFDTETVFLKQLTQITIGRDNHLYQWHSWDPGQFLWECPLWFAEYVSLRPGHCSDVEHTYCSSNLINSIVFWCLLPCRMTRTMTYPHPPPAGWFPPLHPHAPRLTWHRKRVLQGCWPRPPVPCPQRHTVRDRGLGQEPGPWCASSESSSILPSNIGEMQPHPRDVFIDQVAKGRCSLIGWYRPVSECRSRCVRRVY